LIVLRCPLRRCWIGAGTSLCAVKYEVLSSDIADCCVRYRNLGRPSGIISRRRCVIVDSRPVLCVGHGIATVIIIICEVLSLVARLYQLILDLLMQTVDTRIIAVNRCRSHIIRLFGSSILLQYLIWRFVVIRAHHSILIGHHLLLLGLSLHIVRLRGGAAIGVRTSYYVRIKLPLRVRAGSHSTSATYLRRRRVSPHRHLYPTRIEISGSLVHKVLCHGDSRASTWAHQWLLCVN